MGSFLCWTLVWLDASLGLGGSKAVVVEDAMWVIRGVERLLPGLRLCCVGVGHAMYLQGLLPREYGTPACE